MSIIRKTSLAVTAALFATALQAAPVSYDFTLQVDQIGDQLPVFGISALPAGPFTGSFSFDNTGLSAGVFTNLTLSAFSVTVGNFSWGLEDVTAAQVRADAGGALDRVAIYTEDGLNIFRMSFGYYTNTSWFALDNTNLQGCGWQGDPALDMYGACVGGSANAYTLARADDPVQVPLPSSLLLAGLGLGVSALVRVCRKT
ncbi:PEP-CTERM sorting domain-containing protein [Uliginosibacterium sp. H1]|uniref:PEP-CTERM sorting domain-containing protein n=1 Tax=Uliginosibacterium sp. H1 TaxID=3114757 RepID=UPI002E17CF72|nr:PEP-CTERM sorting domain-containing protein [Uliginosibacterium sp. H1]